MIFFQFFFADLTNSKTFDGKGIRNNISGRGGSTPLRELQRYVPPHRVYIGFLRLFGLKTVIDFAHFGLESGVYECIYRFNAK